MTILNQTALPNELSTNQDLTEWHNFLMLQPKETLVKLMLDKMNVDSYFLQSVKLELVAVEVDLDVNKIVEDYIMNVNSELDMQVPNVDYLEGLSNRLLEIADGIGDVKDAIVLYVTVIMSLDAALDSGAGYEMGDEHVLFQVMDEAFESAVAILSTQGAHLHKSAWFELISYLTLQSNHFDTVDGENRIERILGLLSDEAV